MMKKTIAVCIAFIALLGVSELTSHARLPALAQDMQGIYLEEKVRVGIGAQIQIEYIPHLFFKNGDVYTEIDVPLDELDIALSKRTHPNRWGQWRQDGDGLVIDMPDGEHKDKIKEAPALPAGENERLDGRWSAHSVAFGTNNFYTVTENDITFLKSGEFATGKFAGAGGRASSGYAREASAVRGTYRISGYTAEFTYSDGRTERTLFYFYSDKNGERDARWLMLANRPYRRQSDAPKRETNAAPRLSAKSENAKSATPPKALSSEFASTFLTILGHAAMVDELKVVCDRKHPRTASTNTPLLIAWHRANSLKGITALAINFARENPGFRRKITVTDAVIKRKADQFVDNAPALCANFADFLRSKRNDLKSKHERWFAEAHTKLPQFFAK